MATKPSPWQRGGPGARGWGRAEHLPPPARRWGAAWARAQGPLAVGCAKGRRVWQHPSPCWEENESGGSKGRIKGSLARPGSGVLAPKGVWTCPWCKGTVDPNQLQPLEPLDQNILAGSMGK